MVGIIKLHKIKNFLITGSLLVTPVFCFAQKPSLKEMTSGGAAVSEQTPTPSSPTSPAPAQIQSDEPLKTHGVGIGIGQTMPMGEFSRTGDSAITFDLFYTYSASHSFDLLVNFHNNELERGTHKTELTSVNAGIKAKLFNFDNFSPFGLAGLGFYWPIRYHDSGNGIIESDSKTVFGYNFGGGADLRLNRMVSVGAIIQYHNPFDVSQESQSEVQGSYLKLLLTVFYYF